LKTNLVEIRTRLIDGTIRVIAEKGLDKATTKQIGLATGLNEAYIYRCFKDKEEMFAQTFSALDEELVSTALSVVPILYVEEMTPEERCRSYFSSVWRFLLSNQEKCLSFIRYYYSPYFSEFSAEEHQNRYRPLIHRFQSAFHKEANVQMILNHALTTMLDFSVKVFNGTVPDNEDTAEHVFRLVYASLKQYFKTEEKINL